MKEGILLLGHEGASGAKKKTSGRVLRKSLPLSLPRASAFLRWGGGKKKEKTGVRVMEKERGGKSGRAVLKDSPTSFIP